MTEANLVLQSIIYFQNRFYKFVKFRRIILGRAD